MSWMGIRGTSGFVCDNSRTQITPVFVISLEEATSRRERIARHLGKLGIKFEFIAAVNGKRLDKAYAESVTTPMFRNAVGWRGALGCALSHVSIFRRMESENLAQALILEDDVVLNRKARDLVCNPDTEPFDHVFLGCGVFGQVRVGNSFALRRVAYDESSLRYLKTGFVSATLSDGPVRTHAYLISQNAARKRLEDVFPFQQPIDCYSHLECDFKFEAIIKPRMAWISPAGLQSQIRDASKADYRISDLQNPLKRFKWYYPLKDALLLKGRSAATAFDQRLAEGSLASGRWRHLPWGEQDILYKDV